MIDLRLIIDEVINTLRLAADAKSIRLRMVLNAEAGPVAGDSASLQQVVWNLISNAIKSTPSGGEILVRLDRVGSHIKLTVHDTGEGIDPEFLPFIFNRFTQADSSVIRRHGDGLGLGLSIVRHLVELHGGTVQAENLGKGQGCVFIVKLPLRAIKTADCSSSPPSELNRLDGRHSRKNLPVLGGSRVLVVDDDRDNCELLALVLQQAEAEVRCTFSTRDALAVLQIWQPDVLLADIGMPGEDGYTLIRKVRSLAPEQVRNVSAAALTTYAGAQDRAAALSAGFHVHLSKPIEPYALLSTVRGLVEQRQRAKSTSTL